MYADALRILFPTNFSEACERAGQAVAQLATTCRLDLTIVHAGRRARQSRGIRTRLERFLVEANDYHFCQRVLVDSDDPAAAISHICRANRFDLVMAPASDHHGVQGMLTRSFRARLLKQCDVPLWTAGASVRSDTFDRPMKTIACLMDFDDDRAAFVRLVTTFAERVGARTRFLYVVPTVDEATITHALTSDAPLMPSVALKRIRDIFPADQCPEIDVAVGARGRELRRMLSACDADLLFVGPRQASSRSWALRFSRDLDGLPCPVVCVDGAAAGFSHWSFREHATERAAERIDDLENVLVQRF